MLGGVALECWSVARQSDGEKAGFTHFSWTRDSLYGDKKQRNSYGRSVCVSNMERRTRPNHSWFISLVWQKQQDLVNRFEHQWGKISICDTTDVKGNHLFWLLKRKLELLWQICLSTFVSGSLTIEKWTRLLGINWNSSASSSYLPVCPSAVPSWRGGAPPPSTSRQNWTGTYITPTSGISWSNVLMSKLQITS